MEEENPQAGELPASPNQVTKVTENILAVETPDKALYKVDLSEVMGTYPELADLDPMLLYELFEIVPPEALSDFGIRQSNPAIKAF